MGTASHSIEQCITGLAIEDMGERVDWSNLPMDLLQVIGKSLDTQIDVLRFRSICSSWRSSTPSFNTNSIRFPLHCPNPLDMHKARPRMPAFLCQSTLYYIKRVSPPTSSPISHKGRLLKIEEHNWGKLRLLNPLVSGVPCHNTYPINPKLQLLNLFDFVVVELTKAYRIKYSWQTEDGKMFPSNSHIPGGSKVVVFPDTIWTDVDACFILIVERGILSFAKCGDENLTIIGEGRSYYDDVIVYKGQFYVIDNLGMVSWIDRSSMELVQFVPLLHGLGNRKHLVEFVQFVPLLHGLGNRKHLVESGGALYVVDIYHGGQISKNIVGCAVYKLDEEVGQWVPVKSLGNQVFILGDDCSVSVSAQEFLGFQGDFIHLFGFEYGSPVLNLKDQSVKLLYSSKEHSELFLLPPPL